MGLFKRKPKADEIDAPLVRGDGETSFTVPAGTTTWAYKRVLRMLGWQRPVNGASTDRLDVVLRVVGNGVVVKHEGYPLGFVGARDVELVRSAMEDVGSAVIRARAYIWRSRRDGTLGVRIYLPA